MPTAGDVVDLQISAEDHQFGPADAPITLVEYGDYECPDCLSTFPLIEQLAEDLGEDLRFVFRHFPLISIHPRASFAAQAAEAAGAQHKFWEMHRLLYQRPGGLDDDELARLGLRLELELYRYENDLSTQRFANRVQRQADFGREIGVSATPTLFVNGRRIGLTKPATYEQLRAQVDALR